MSAHPIELGEPLNGIGEFGFLVEEGKDPKRGVEEKNVVWKNGGVGGKKKGIEFRREAHSKRERKCV